VNSWIAWAAFAAAILLLPRLLARKAAPALVRERLSAGAAVLDVRSAGEFQGGAFPGATHVPLGELSGRLGRLRKDRPLIVYCASGMRSAAAVRLLKRAGFDAVNAGGLRDMPR